MLAVLKQILGTLPVHANRIPRRVRNVAISASVLLMLLVAGGIAYTWYVDQGPAPLPVVPASSTASYTPVTPKKPAPDAAESVATQMVTSPVSVGSAATVSVQANPYSTCQIAVIYNYDPSKRQIPVSDPALAPQTADAFGSVSWTWTVSPSAALGKGNATVTCTYHLHTGVVEAEVDVTR